MMRLRKMFVAAAAALAPLMSAMAETPSYMPQIHGVVRARYEMTTTGPTEYRFQVRNARVKLSGAVGPSVDYFIQTDLCDRGQMKILDAWGRIAVARGLKIQAGQFRIPFGVETFRHPGNYIFANRSYIGKQMCNYRAVGAKASYSLPGAPVMIEAGVFNSRAIGSHDVWQRRVAAGGKVVYSPGPWSFSAGMASVTPDSVRANMLDAAVTYTRGRWEAAAEYMYEHYTGAAHSPAHGWTAWADYHMPVKAGMFHTLSVQGRYDGLTSHAALTAKSIAPAGEQRILPTTNERRHRITAGATLTAAVSKALAVDLRANYEHVFFDKRYAPSADEGSRALIEMVVRF